METYCECNQRCEQTQLASDSACEDNSVLETHIAHAKGDSQAQLLVPFFMSLGWLTHTREYWYWLAHRALRKAIPLTGENQVSNLAALPYARRLLLWSYRGKYNCFNQLWPNLEHQEAWVGRHWCSTSYSETYDCFNHWIMSRVLAMGANHERDWNPVSDGWEPALYHYLAILLIYLRSALWWAFQYSFKNLTSFSSTISYLRKLYNLRIFPEF